MSVTYPLSLPTVRNPVSMTLRQRKVVGVNVAPGSLVPQVYEWPGERWELDMTFNVMERDVGGAWAGFLSALRGSVGSFLAGDPTGTGPIGTAGGTPTVNGTTLAGARVLPVSGGTGTLKAGSLFSLGSGATRQLYQVQTDASLSSGLLDIWPALRLQAANATPIQLTNPTGRFMLKPGTMPEWTIDQKGYYHIANVSAWEDRR